jgi:hypothetical protein
VPEPPRYPRKPKPFLFQLPNPLLQKLPLWFLVGSGPTPFHKTPEPQPSCRTCRTYPHGGMRQVIICQFAMFQHRVDMLRPASGPSRIASHAPKLGQSPLYRFLTPVSQTAAIIA